MSYQEEYQQKLKTADEAVQVDSYRSYESR